MVFEDAPVGVAAGLASGATVVGMTTTFAALDGCAQRVADFSAVRVIETGPPMQLEIAAALPSQPEQRVSRDAPAS